ncbi:MAG TPA: amidohydrolase family protein [Candidatus Polarisedimenticolaceae bacterium]
MRFRDAHTHLSAGLLDRASRVGGFTRRFGWSSARAAREAILRLPADEPALFARGDGHAAWLNGAALRALGHPDAREPRLVEEADYEALRRRLPAPTREERGAALRSGLEQLAAVGIDRVVDIVEPFSLDAWSELREAGELTCRIEAWLPLDLDEEEAAALRRRFPPGDPWIAVTTRKVFLDGTLGARTAAMLEPYADRGGRGELREEMGSILPRVRAAVACGWPVAFHAIGDAAVRLALDVAERVPEGRFRVEHAQIVDPADLPRFASLGVVASMQPAHLRLDEAILEPALGRRAAHAFPWTALARSGARLEFGSDWPVAPMDPRPGIEAAVAAGLDRRAAAAAYGSL